MRTSIDMSTYTPPWCSAIASDLSEVLGCLRCGDSCDFSARSDVERERLAPFRRSWNEHHRRCRATARSIGPALMARASPNATEVALDAAREFVRVLEVWGVPRPSHLRWKGVDPLRIDGLNLSAACRPTRACAHALFLVGVQVSRGFELREELVRLGAPSGVAALVAGFLADEIAWRTACALNLKVPAGESDEEPDPSNDPPPELIGREFASLESPWTSYLDVAACGALIESVTPERLTLLRCAPSTGDSV